MFYYQKLKQIWGRIVFRYAGRNIAFYSPTHSRAFYDLVGRFYDWLYVDHVSGYKQAIQYLVDHHIDPGNSVLDIGCGTGQIIDYVKPKAGMVVGIDISIQMLKQTRKKLANCNDVLLVSADSRNLPLKASFDKIVSCFMLVILSREDRMRVIQSFEPLLSENGALIFLTAQDNLSPQWLTMDEWRSFCHKAGFSLVEKVDILDYYRIIIARKNVS